MKEVAKCPITTAVNPNGIVIAKAAMVSGSLEISTQKNRSLLPMALRIFIFKELIGVIILAKHSHCIRGTTGIHLSVKKKRTKGSDKRANKVRVGTTKKTTIPIKRP